MRFFSEEKVSEVRDRSSIVEVISGYVSLKKAGRNFRGLCPFHSEKTPSFMVNEEKQIFHCFGCGAGGDVFSFLMKVNQISFPEAVEEVARRYGVSLPLETASPIQTKEAARREAFFQINELASNYFQENLTRRREGEPARQYLAQRGIRGQTIDEFHLGYAVGRWDGLLQYLRKHGASLSMASELGLLIPKGKESWFDAFRGRVMFPIRNLQGRIVGFGGRAIGAGHPKYLNSPDSSLYHKGEILYGLREAKTFLRQSDQVMIVEGYFDLLMLHQSGLRQSVATLGTALTTYHLRLLRRYTQRMVLVFDGDAAGQQASLRLLPLFLEEGLWPKVVLLPEGEDPDGFLRKGRLEDFKRRITEGPLLMDFFLDRLARMHPVKSVEGRAKCADEALAMIQRIPDVIQRDFYLKVLAERLELEVSLLRNRIGRGLKGRLRMETEAQGPLSQRYDSRAEETVVRLMTQDPRWVGRVLEERVIDEFESPSLQQIARAMEEVYRRRGDLPLSEVMAGLEETLQDKLRRIIFKEVVFEEGIEEKILDDCVQKIRERRLKRDKSELRRRIREAEKETGGEVLEALLAEHQALARREVLLRKSGP